MITLPFETPLLQELSRRLRALHHKDLSSYLETLVILPTRCVIKDLKNELFEGAYSSVFLPKIISITDLVSNDISMEAIQKVEATGVCLSILKEMGEPPSIETVQTLLALMSEVATFEVNLDNIDSLVPETYGEHWQVTSDFLGTFSKKWEKYLKEKNLVLPETKAILGYKKLAEKWQETPPLTPLWMAGIDGYSPALSGLMKVVDHLPQGAVFWSGILPATEASCKKNHPNYLYQKNCVLEGELNEEENQGIRANLLSHMMSDEPFDKRDFDGVTFKGISLFQADSLEKEAEMIALLARENLEDLTKTTAIITPDPDLSHKVQQALARFNIRVDVAGGRPLSKTKQGQYAIDVLSLPPIMGHDKAPLILSILKNKLSVFSAKSSLQLQQIIPEFDLSLRGSSRVNLSLDCLTLKKLYQLSLAPLVALKQQERASLNSWVQVHFSLLEEISPDFFQGEIGAAIKAHFLSLKEKSDHYPDLDFQTYEDLVRMRFTSSMERGAINHPRLKLMNPIQGAYGHFDSVILGGLNEGVWPATPPLNPWLNLDMQLKLGLSDSQVLLGREAWLLVQNMRNSKIVMTYSKRRGSDPATPSRWVLRLKALEEVLGEKQSQLSLPPYYKKWQESLDAPVAPQQSKRPVPCPPLKERPRRLSISDIQRLFKDPYQIYAKKILSIYPLTDLDADIESSDYGTFVHALLERHILDEKSVFDLLQKTSYEDVKQQFPLCDKSTFFLWRHSISQYLPWLEGYLSSQLRKGSFPNSEIFVEKKMAFTSTLFDWPMEIVGTADRIDRLRDGSYEIIDYKTGYVPTKKDVKSFMAPQLALLGMLFEKNSPGEKVSKLTYVGLGSQKIVSFEAPELIKDTMDYLTVILRKYQDEKAPYDISIINSLLDPFNDYTHLERTSEWLAELKSQKEGS